MRTKFILFFPDNPIREFTSVFEIRSPSLQVKHLPVDSSKNQLVVVYKGVQKKKSAYSIHFSLSQFYTSQPLL